MNHSYKKILCIAACVAAIALAAWTTWRLLPSSAEAMRHSAVVVNDTWWHEVSIDGKPLLFFGDSRGDSVLYGLTTVRDSALHHSLRSGFWADRWLLAPSCKGTIVSVYRETTGPLQQCADSVIVRLCRESVTRKLKELRRQKSELDYYMRVHGVQDYGYQEVAALDTRISNAYADAERVLHLLDSLHSGVHGVCVKTRHEYTAVYRSESGRLMRSKLSLVKCDGTSGVAVLRTADGTTPDGAAAVAILPWNMGDGGEVRVVGIPTIGEKGLECDTVSPRILPGTVFNGKTLDIPKLLATDGAPVFSTKGRFVGMINGDSIVTRRTIRGKVD